MTQMTINPDLDQLIKFYQDATDFVMQPEGLGVIDYLNQECQREEAIYGISILIGIAAPNPDRTVTNEQWNTCIDYINTRNQTA